MESQNPDVFSNISLAPPDPILGITQAWKADKDSNKLNLGVGAYRDDDEKPYVFQAVRKALQEVVADPNLDLEYLPIDGHAGLRDSAQKLLFGAENSFVKEGKIATVQSLSGTGALRVGFAFIKRFLEGTVYVSKPTWANHLNIISDSNLNYKEYNYLDDKGVNLNFDAVRHSISNAPAGSIILLHVCAHNPTGVDPSVEQWRELAKIIKEKKLFPFFDCAYQGFASGSLEKDREPIEIFLKEGLQMLVAQSFAKNFGLYGERVGALHVVCNSKETVEKVMSQLKALIRPMYSNPPAIGAKIVHKILSNKELTQQWEQELKDVSERLQKMRKLLFDELKALGVKGNWDHIVSQIGMFSYTGLNTKQCEALTEKHHVYLVKNGRISMAGVNSHNVKRLAEGIKDAVENH